MRVLVVIILLLLGLNALIVVPALTAFIASDSFKSWQTLTAGLIAVAGAIATVVVMRAQISQAERLASEQRRRDEMAARAVLPLALSELCRYATDCIRTIMVYVPQPAPWGTPAPAVPANSSLPLISPDVISTLRDCVRFGDPRVVRQIATVLANLQVQRARLHGLFADAVSRHNGVMSRFEALGRMIDAAELYAQAEALFDYGREVADMSARSRRAQITRAFFVAGIVDVDNPELFQIIESRYPE